MVLLFPRNAFSQSAEERGLRLLSKGKYFTLYGPTNLNISGILSKLDFDYTSQFDTLYEKDSTDLTDILAKTIDSIYLESADILDIHVYSFEGNIKFLFNQNDVEIVFKDYFKQSLGERSFYIADNKTIYISYEDLTLGMLAHEIAHAIMSAYFVVPPPTKVQEVLAGYVEYTLRKKSGNLSK